MEAITVRILDWRNEPYYAVNEMPTGVDITKREFTRFEKEYEHYKADHRGLGPRQVNSKNGKLTLNKIKVDETALKELRDAIDQVFNEHSLGSDNTKGKSAFLYSITNKYYNIKNSLIIAIHEKLGVDLTYSAMALFLLVKTYQSKNIGDTINETNLT